MCSCNFQAIFGDLVVQYIKLSSNRTNQTVPWAQHYTRTLACCKTRPWQQSGKQCTLSCFCTISRFALLDCTQCCIQHQSFCPEDVLMLALLLDKLPRILLLNQDMLKLQCECRCIQVADQPIILTGFSALNKLLGREVYSSQMQLGGPKVLHPSFYCLTLPRLTSPHLTPHLAASGNRGSTGQPPMTLSLSFSFYSHGPLASQLCCLAECLGS